MRDAERKQRWEDAAIGVEIIKGYSRVEIAQNFGVKSQLRIFKLIGGGIKNDICNKRISNGEHRSCDSDCPSFSYHKRPSENHGRASEKVR